MANNYDVAALRAHFPALAEGAAHFDGAGGTQVPAPVGAAVASALTSAVSNRGRLTRAERRAGEYVSGARAALADLLGARPDGVVFGRSMTQLTYDVARAMAKTWHPGDEIVVSRLDHDANIRPWIQAAAATGASVRWIDFDPVSGELSTDHVAAVLSERTRLVALTAASNLIGTRPPIPRIAALAHRAGALLYVDGVHLAPHGPVDLAAMGADFLVCSPYKFLGPHLGVLAASPEVLDSLHPDKLLPASDQVPERFEVGTLPYELLAGCTATVDFLAAIAPDGGARSTQGPDRAPAAQAPDRTPDPPPPAPTPATPAPNPAGTTARRRDLLASMAAVDAHERALQHRLETALAEMPGLVRHSVAAERTPTTLLTVDGGSAAALAGHLADRGINAPAGSFYAVEPSRRLGLGTGGGLRVAMAPYTDDDDLDRLVAGLADYQKGR